MSRIRRPAQLFRFPGCFGRNSLSKSKRSQSSRTSEGEFQDENAFRQRIRKHGRFRDQLIAVVQSRCAFITSHRFGVAGLEPAAPFATQQIFNLGGCFACASRLELLTSEFLYLMARQALSEATRLVMGARLSLERLRAPTR